MFVALNGTEDSEMRKDIVNMDLEKKSLQNVTEMIYLTKKVVHMNYISGGGRRDDSMVPARISCFRCIKACYKNQCPLPVQVCPEANCGRDPTKAGYIGYQGTGTRTPTTTPKRPVQA